MIEPKVNEPRIEYLARVLWHLMNETGACCYTIEYDGTTCDGLTLANDIVNELGLETSYDDRPL